MSTMLERRYRRQHLNCVRHITLDPKGRGVVRIHMIPPREDAENAPFLLLLNGSKLVPLNLSWAILLSCFMDRLEPFAGLEITESDWNAMAAGAVARTHKVYPFTPKERLAEDLQIMIESLVAIARGQEPEAEVAPLTLGEYAPEMTAPHRMDLMVSAMTRDGAWHCNQKCLHCYAAGQPLSDTPELTTAQWKEILTKLRAANIPQVTFTGGEPTLRADLVELVDAAQWFVTRLNTNGRLLTPALCQKLYDASLDSVQVTLYSHDKDIHNALVGADGFDDTVAGIRAAVAAGLSVSVNTPLCSLNTAYDETLRFVHSLGVRYVTCSGLIPSGGAVGDESRATALTEQQLTDVLTKAVAVTEELEMELDFTSPGWLKEETLRALGLTLVPSCGACLSNMAVAPDGGVIPCQSWLSSQPLGNILADDWDKIWQSERCAAIRARAPKWSSCANCVKATGRRAPYAEETARSAACLTGGGLLYRHRMGGLRLHRAVRRYGDAQHGGWQPAYHREAGVDAAGGAALRAGAENRRAQRLHPGRGGTDGQHRAVGLRQQLYVCLS